MEANEILARLDAVRSRGANKSSARCPAHADRSPSLSLRVAEDGRILVHCFAGCTVHEICRALGLSVGELFPDPPKKGRKGASPRPRPWRFKWQRTAFEFQFYADGLWLRGQRMLGAAKGMDTSGWIDEDFDVAMEAVCRAYDNLDRADLLEDVAFRVRVRGLTKEKQGDAN